MNNAHAPSFEVIERWLNDKNYSVRIAAMNACQGCEIPFEVIEQGLRDENWQVRLAAMNNCQGREIPFEIIEQGLRDKNYSVRIAAMNACQGRKVSSDIIERGLNDEDYDVRVVAMNVCRANGFLVPIVRTFEPPERVYKKCLGDVIVVAEIPKDAQIRGRFDYIGRADKAVIKDIIGDLCGEPVGVSIYDMKTLYYAGDEVEIDNFDYSAAWCSTGFHFCNTIEKLMNMYAEQYLDMSK